MKNLITLGILPCLLLSAISVEAAGPVDPGSTSPDTSLYEVILATRAGSRAGSDAEVDLPKTHASELLRLDDELVRRNATDIRAKVAKGSRGTHQSPSTVAAQEKSVQTGPITSQDEAEPTSHQLYFLFKWWERPYRKMGGSSQTRPFLASQEPLELLYPY